MRQEPSRLPLISSVRILREVHHWQAIYRQAFYRGGPVLTAVESGIDMALRDIKGKALGLPVCKLLGRPTRDRIRVCGNRKDVETAGTSALNTQMRANGSVLDWQPAEHCRGGIHTARSSGKRAARRPPLLWRIRWITALRGVILAELR